MANEKEIIQKLLKIAQNQQKIIEKLAQNTPRQYTKEEEKAIYDKYDPLRGFDEDILGTPQTPKASTPPTHPAAPPKIAPEWLNKYMDQEHNKTAPLNPSSPLPEGFKEILDKAAPSLKTNLMLSVNGKSIDVKYNNNKLNYRPVFVKDLLTRAFPGYTVNDPIAETGNLNFINDWHPNY